MRRCFSMFAASTVSCPFRAGPTLARSVCNIRSASCSASAQIRSSVEPVARVATPVNFKWTPARSKGLSQDACRYEAELRELFESDDKHWANHDVVRS